MKRSLIFVGLFLFSFVLLINLSVFVSAQSTWKITEPIGICGGASGTNSDGGLSFASECIGYSSSEECEAISSCQWETMYREFMSNPIRVNEGWNLMWGLTYPSQISSGLDPDNVKAIYDMNPITKEYGLYFSSPFVEVINETNAYINREGYTVSAVSPSTTGFQITEIWAHDGNGYNIPLHRGYNVTSYPQDIVVFPYNDSDFFSKGVIKSMNVTVAKMVKVTKKNETTNETYTEEELVFEEVELIFDKVILSYTYEDLSRKLQTYDPSAFFDEGYLEGYHLAGQSGGMNWVYFDESGDITYRTIDLKELNIKAFGENNPNVWIYDPFLNEFLTAGISMISGWNFLALTPTFFYDYGSADDPDDWGKKTSFMLSDFVGNCNIDKAYFYGGTDPNDVSSIGQWTEVGITESIQDTNLFRVIIVKVTNDCILGKNNHQKICTDTDGLLRKTIKGDVTIKDNAGNVLTSEEDICTDDSNVPGRKILQEKYCKYDEGGNVSIGTLPFWETESESCIGEECKILKETCSGGKITITQI